MQYCRFIDKISTRKTCTCVHPKVKKQKHHYQITELRLGHLRSVWLQSGFIFVVNSVNSQTQTTILCSLRFTNDSYHQ